MRAAASSAAAFANASSHTSNVGGRDARPTAAQRLQERVPLLQHPLPLAPEILLRRPKLHDELVEEPAAAVGRSLHQRQLVGPKKTLTLNSPSARGRDRGLVDQGARAAARFELHVDLDPALASRHVRVQKRSLGAVSDQRRVRASAGSRARSGNRRPRGGSSCLARSDRRRGSARRRARPRGSRSSGSPRGASRHSTLQRFLGQADGHQQVGERRRRSRPGGSPASGRRRLEHETLRLRSRTRRRRGTAG